MSKFFQVGFYQGFQLVHRVSVSLWKSITFKFTLAHVKLISNFEKTKGYTPLDIKEE